MVSSVGNTQLDWRIAALNRVLSIHWQMLSKNMVHQIPRAAQGSTPAIERYHAKLLKSIPLAADTGPGLCSASSDFSCGASASSRLWKGQRQLDCRNWAEAENHLSLALAERRHSKHRRCQLLLNLERAQRRQGKFTEAEQSLQAALALASNRSLSTQAQILQAEQADSRPDGARLARCY